MLARLLYHYTAGRPARLIKINGKPYIERYYLGQRHGWTFYLHRYNAADGDRYLHDHPWEFAVGIPLVGRYIERRLRWHCPDTGPNVRMRTISRFRINRIPASAFHQIHWVQPGTWTLFAHTTARPKHWGMLKSGVHQPYPDRTLEDWHQTAPLGRDIGREPFKDTL